MFRYIALVSSGNDREQIRAAALLKQRLRDAPSPWQLVFERPGVHVCCSDLGTCSLAAHVLPAGMGVVLGTVFARGSDVEDDSPQARIGFDAAQTEAIVSSRGRWLIDRCWGNYVALVRDMRTNGWQVIKDPCGPLPCFSTQLGRLTVLFSAIEDCVALGARFTVNRPHIEARLICGGLTQTRDALNEVVQVCRGECAGIDPDRQPGIVTKQWYWHPATFAQAELPIDDVLRAERALRSTLRACTSTLVSQHRSMLLRLSGGLDSSIVLACVSRAARKPELLACTQYVPNGSDPRPWARLAAEHAACEQVADEVTPSHIRLADLLRIAPSPEPPNAFMLLATGAREQRLAEYRRATGVLSGDGGDCAFGSLCVADVVPAYLRRCGLTPLALKLAAQSALALRQTAWGVLMRSLRAWVRPQSTVRFSDRHREARKLLAADLSTRACRMDDPHPWIAAARPSSETLSKLGALLGSPDLYAGVASATLAAPEPVAPIYSQPVMELCLRIPADILFADGRDRGLARRAFENDVPAPILRRAWKDRAGTFHEEVVHLNLGWLREICLDGVLVREGWLDRAAVERALTGAPGRTQVHAGEILRHLETEIWLQQWQSLARNARDLR